MAQIPSEEDVKKLQEEAAKAAAKKLESQEKQGKGFEDNGQGVMPEAYWKSLPGKAE